jgi:hypothetical protein
MFERFGPWAPAVKVMCFALPMVMFIPLIWRDYAVQYSVAMFYPP